MGCLKCGRKTENNQVFCPTCQEVMQQHPVKPGAIVHIPRRSAPAADKAASETQWEATPAGQLSRLRRAVRWLTAAIALLSFLLCITAGMLIRTLLGNNNQSAIGQNYTTSQTDKKP